MDAADFPFKSVVSLKPLIEAWRAVADANDNNVRASLHAAVLAQINAVPALEALAADSDVLEEHRDLVDLLMSAVFPQARDLTMPRGRCTLTIASSQRTTA